MILDTTLEFRIDYVDVKVCEELGSSEEDCVIDKWSISELYNTSYPSLEELVSAIHKNEDIFPDDLDYYYFIDDGILEADATVDGDGCIPSDVALQSWRNGDLTLYTANLTVGISVVENRYINGKLESSNARELIEEDLDYLVAGDD